MPTIWEDKYLENHTKTQLNKLLDSYDKAEWQCPRCLEVNPCWNRMRVIAGWSTFGTKYTINNDCYDCSYHRASSKSFNLNGKAPKKKPRKINPTKITELRFEDGDSDKWWNIELYKSSKKVVVKWGRWGSFGTVKTHEFNSPQEAQDFYSSKIDEKLNKGYYDVNEHYQKAVARSKAARKAAATRKKKSMKKAPSKSRAKKKVLTRSK